MSNEFIYKSGEYAKILGIPKETLRSRRRTGKLEGEYIFQNGITLYRKPTSKARSTPPGQRSSVRAKRIGIHGTGNENYGKNYHFKQHNELKMLAKLQRNVDSEIQELLPEAIEQAKRIKEQRQQQMQKQLMQPVRKYGQMLRGVQYTSPKNSSSWNTVFEEDRKIEEESKPPKKKFPEYY
tara:strand:- start:231 stop:773 length:543 start_codon:yes stop_codon:yes gene_type:complete